MLTETAIRLICLFAHHLPHLDPLTKQAIWVSQVLLFFKLFIQLFPCKKSSGWLIPKSLWFWPQVNESSPFMTSWWIDWMQCHSWTTARIRPTICPSDSQKKWQCDYILSPSEGYCDNYGPVLTQAYPICRQVLPNSFFRYYSKTPYQARVSIGKPFFRHPRIPHFCS